MTHDLLRFPLRHRVVNRLNQEAEAFLEDLLERLAEEAPSVTESGGPGDF